MGDTWKYKIDLNFYCLLHMETFAKLTHRFQKYTGGKNDCCMDTETASSHAVMAVAPGLEEASAGGG